MIIATFVAVNDWRYFQNIKAKIYMNSDQKITNDMSNVQQYWLIQIYFVLSFRYFWCCLSFPFFFFGKGKAFLSSFFVDVTLTTHKILLMRITLQWNFMIVLSNLFTLSFCFFFFVNIYSIFIRSSSILISFIFFVNVYECNCINLH